MSAKKGSKESGSTSLPEDTGKPSENDYQVGYGKPPKHSQFKHDNTFGLGRRTGSKNLKTIVKEALGAKVPVTIGGKTRKLTKLELTVHQIANKASQGDMKAIEKVIQLEERYGTLDNSEAPAPEKLKHDLATLRDYLALQEFINPDHEENDDE